MEWDTRNKLGSELKVFTQLSKSSLLNIIQFVLFCKAVKDINSLSCSIQSIMKDAFQDDNIKMIYCGLAKGTAAKISSDPYTREQVQTKCSNTESSCSKKSQKSSYSQTNSNGSKTHLSSDDNMTLECLKGKKDNGLCLLISKDDLSDYSEGTDVMSSLLPYIEDAFDRIIAQGAIDAEPIQLTPRESEVLNWVSQGKGGWETGKIIGISERTVKFHLQNTYRKMNVLNRAQAIAKAIKFDLL